MKTRMIMTAVISIFTLAMLAACSSDTKNAGNDSTVGNKDTAAGDDAQVGAMGSVRVTMQDAPANVEKLEVTISEVAVHFVPAGQTEEDVVAGQDTQSDTAMLGEVTGDQPIDGILAPDTEEYTDAIELSDVVDGDTSASYKSKGKPVADVVTDAGEDALSGETISGEGVYYSDDINADISWVEDGFSYDSGISDVAAIDLVAVDTSAEEIGAGWRIVFSGEKTLDLITLKDNPIDLGVLNLPAGKVTQVRLYLSETTAPKAVIDGVEVPVTVASGKIKLVRGFDIVAGQETVIKLDFDAAESLKENGKGEYRLQPTIKFLD